MTNRRQFLKTSALAAAATNFAAPRWLRASTPIDVHPRAEDPVLRELAMRALDAAKSGETTYADVRITVDRKQSFFFGSPPTEEESIAIGVRALVNGAWGFVASNVWTLDEAARLGRAAVSQARANVWPGEPPTVLGPPPQPATGSWVMPVKRDPFAVTVAEKLDYIRSAESYARTLRYGSASSVIIFFRQEKTFASSDGAFFTQTVFNTCGHDSTFTVHVSDMRRRRTASRGAPFITPTGTGYELFDDARLIDRIPELYDDARRQLDSEPTTGTRADVVFDGTAMAALVSQTLGAPLELDRALGLEANAGGTSYLAPAARVLGATFASPLLNVTADRSTLGGVATVKWDDDGITPEAFALVRNGTVVDYQTNREHAGALTSWYERQGHAVRSHGCATSSDAAGFPIVRSGNLHMAPVGTATFDDLVSQVKDGFAITGGGIDTDHQRLTGQGMGELVFRVKNGKIINPIQGAAYLFRSPELWKNVIAVGGDRTVETRGFQTFKGQPNQFGYHSVSAPAAIIKNIAVFDVRAASGQ